jgi:hypothetical protein
MVRTLTLCDDCECYARAWDCDALITDGTVAGIPEHFFFDVAEATVREIK